MDVVDAVIAREMRHHLHHQQQASVYVGSISPSAQFAPAGSPDQPEIELASDLGQDHAVVYVVNPDCPSAQFAELAPTGAHHTASPDQPESGSSGFVNFDSMDWDLTASCRPERPDPVHPVVKVEATEIMDLLDYSLAAFNPPSDSLSSYPDIFDKPGGVEQVYDDDDEDDDVDDDVTGLDFKQTQQQLLMQDVNSAHAVCDYYYFMTHQH